MSSVLSKVNGRLGIKSRAPHLLRTSCGSLFYSCSHSARPCHDFRRTCKSAVLITPAKYVEGPSTDTAIFLQRKPVISKEDKKNSCFCFPYLPSLGRCSSQERGLLTGEMRFPAGAPFHAPLPCASLTIPEEHTEAQGDPALLWEQSGMVFPPYKTISSSCAQGWDCSERQIGTRQIRICLLLL